MQLKVVATVTFKAIRNQNALLNRIDDRQIANVEMNGKEKGKRNQ